MKIEGFSGDFVKKKKVKIERENGSSVELLLTALPPSFSERVMSELPEPVAPRAGSPARDENGKIVREGGVPVFPPNEKDPQYQKELAEYQNLYTIAMIYNGLRNDEDISFDTDESGLSGKELYRGVRDELEEFGFDMGDIAQIGREIISMSNINKEDIDEARENF